MKTKLHFQRIFATLLLLAVSMLSWADEFEDKFEVDGIFYNGAGSNATVTRTNKYSGSVTIPSTVRYGYKTYSVTSIGKYAFSGRTGLTSIKIPASVTSIGESAFKRCSGLTSFTIPSGVTSIGDDTFLDCSSLKSVSIPSSVTSIGKRAFKGCSSLTSIPIFSVNGDGWPESNVQKIGEKAFAGCSSLTSFKIPASVTTIWDDAFDGCSNLTYVVLKSDAIVSKGYSSSRNLGTIFGSQVEKYEIGDGVIDIGINAFLGCSNVKSIYIAPHNSSLTGIYNHAFEGCSSLTTINIPSSVTIIREGAFEGCSALKSVTLNSDDFVSALYDTDHNMSKIFGSQVEEYIIGNNVTMIGMNAFSDCSALKSVTIGDYVTCIGARAFRGCSGLTSVIIPGSTTIIDAYAFSGCSGLTYAYFYGGSSGKKSIGNNAFSDCSSMTYVNFNSSVKNIGESAFSGCSNLTSVYFAQNLTSIGTSAFENCSNLTTIEYLNSVTSIGKSAFSGCSGLTSFKIPSSVVSIGERAFSGCSGLTSVTCNATIVPITGNNAFASVPQSEATLYVPQSSVSSYRIADQWKEFGTILSTGGGGDDDRIYIETDLTSEFPVDWQGWNGATGYVGWAAPQVTTNDGRTTPACEKFNDSSAEQGTVFTRPLTGLANGTYRIELYGAAASTKGRDTGIDSEMTASNEGDETAVYLYAKTVNGTVKQYIPVHWATSFSEIATAVLNGVTVTDGTVELGMVSEKKFTNWEVIQIKGVTALVDATVVHANTLSKAIETLNDAAYVNVTGFERTTLSQTISNNTTVSEQTAEAYQTAVNALEMAMKAFTDAKASYDAWVDIKGRNFPYASVAKKDAAESAAAVSPTSAADVVSRMETLLPLYRQYAESSAMLEGVNGATNMTSYINNPKAEEGVDGWTTVRGEGSGGSINILDGQPWTDGSGDTNHKYFDGGNWGASAWDVAFQQGIMLPAGKYQLTAIGRSERDVALTLFAGDETAEMAHISSVGGLFNNGWEQTSLEFELTGNTIVSIGVRGVTSLIHNWMSFSNFRLVQFPEGYDAINSLTAEKTIVDANAPIYDLNGRRLTEKPKSGYYIQGGKKYYVEK